MASYDNAQICRNLLQSQLIVRFLLGTLLFCILKVSLLAAAFLIDMPSLTTVDLPHAFEYRREVYINSDQ